MFGIFASNLKALPPVLDSVLSWKKQAISLKVDLNTFLKCKQYAAALSMVTIPKDSISSWKNKAIKLTTDLNTYLTACLMSASGGLGGSLNANYIPYAVNSTSLSNSVINQLNGNIGINVVPTDKITIKALSSEGLTLLNSAGSRMARLFAYDGLGGNLYLHSSAGDDNKIVFGSTTNSWINSGAYFGLGTSAPNDLFHIDAPSNGQGLTLSRSYLNKLRLFTYAGVGGVMYIYDDIGNLAVSLSGDGATNSMTGHLRLVSLPTSAIGLLSGELWRNGSVINIVP